MLQEFRLLLKFYHSIEILLIREVIPKQYQKHGASMKIEDQQSIITELSLG